MVFVFDGDETDDNDDDVVASTVGVFGGVIMVRDEKLGIDLIGLDCCCDCCAGVGIVDVDVDVDVEFRHDKQMP